MCKHTLLSLAATAMVSALSTILLIGCSTAPQTAGGPTTKQADVINGRGRAELWSQTCNRCHNALSPDQYNPAQWEVIVHHMRLRAGLTEEEQKAIVEFLQSSN
jgi:hypothetical protein